MKNVIVALGVVISLIAFRQIAYAHCDTMDGPVVQAGMKALDTSDVDAALIWIQPKDEAELRAAFEQARKVRKQGPDARALADRYFLETLVRLHRAGEGEPYTGIKPAGEKVAPSVAAADAAIVSGSARAVTSMILDSATAGIKERLDRVVATRKFKPHDVRAGREHVAAYVSFVHYVEALHAIAAGEHGEAEAAPAPAHGH